MSRSIRYTSRFKKDYKRERKTHQDLDEVFKPVLDLLLAGKVLPVKLKDHPLSGPWNDHRDCHLKPDLVLIYSVGANELTLVRIGSHSELF